MRGRPLTSQNCFGVGNFIRSPQPAAGSTTPTLNAISLDILTFEAHCPLPGLQIEGVTCQKTRTLRVVRIGRHR